MQFDRLGTGDGVTTERIVWADDSGGQLPMTVVIPTNAQLNRTSSRFRIGSPKADWAGWIRYVSRHWITDIEGEHKNPDGEVIDFTVAEMRFRLLNKYRNIFEFVVARIGDVAEETEQGNAGSGTVS